MTGGFVKKKINFVLQKKKNCSNATIHMEISACKKTRERNEQVRLNMLFFTFTSKTAGGVGRLVLLKFALSLHYAVGRSGELLLECWLW